MIIDTHLHEGRQGIFSLPYGTLLEQMDRNGIDKGLVSTVACCEYRADAEELLPEQIPQVQANRELLQKAEASGGRLYLSFWCKPAAESAAGVYEFIRENRRFVRGLKLHPFYSRLALEDDRYVPYLEIARELGLPVSVHTAADRLSSPQQLLALARRFPPVPFIMVHMGLCSDNEEAIRCVAQADNLFGDTTWVPLDKVRKAIQVCGSGKMLFGSDAPIDGDRSYAFYGEMLRLYRETPDRDWENLFYKNAAGLFGL